MDEIEKEVSAMKTQITQNAKAKEKWIYDITWKVQDGLLSYEDIENIAYELKLLEEQEEIQIHPIEITHTRLTFKVVAKEQLNITKWQTTLQKKVTAKFRYHVKQFELERIVSHGQVVAKEDIRLNKLIDAICEVDYYDLEEGMIDEDCHQLKEYLKEQTLGLIEQKGQTFLIDIEALQAEINLNCFECTKRHQYGCCCGSPCAMSEKNMTLLDRHLVAMEDALKGLDEKQYQTLTRNGGFVTAHGKIKSFDGHCAFLIEHEGIYKCMAHKYALDEQIPIYTLCPLSCLMYPLEILELVTDKRRKMYLITSAVEEHFAANFSRWGSYTSLDVELRCIRKEAADEGFRKEAYRPVYKVNEGLLTHEFGRNLYEGISLLIEAKK